MSLFPPRPPHWTWAPWHGDRASSKWWDRGLIKSMTWSKHGPAQEEACVHRVCLVWKQVDAWLGGPGFPSGKPKILWPQRAGRQATVQNNLANVRGIMTNRVMYHLRRSQTCIMLPLSFLSLCYPQHCSPQSVNVCEDLINTPHIEMPENSPWTCGFGVSMENIRTRTIVLMGTLGRSKKKNLRELSFFLIRKNESLNQWYLFPCILPFLGMALPKQCPLVITRADFSSFW